MLSCITINLHSQLSVNTDEVNANYSTGETIEFIINSNTSGQATWELRYDTKSPVINSGTINLIAGQPYIISHVETSPGVVLCVVIQSGITAKAAAAISPYDISPFENIPSDLDSFWTSKKQELTNIPINPQLTFHSTNDYSTTYSVILDNIAGRKVYGYLSIPNGTGPFPAVVTLPPYGSTANITVPEYQLSERAGVLSFSVSIHNVPPNQIDPNAYLPDNFDNKDENYYKFGLMGAVRAIDYLFTRSDFDGQNLGVTGTSQGGGLSICLSGIDDRINLLMYSVPVLSQNAGLAQDKAGGFPNYVKISRDLFGTIAHELATIDATRYYDGMFLAQKCNYPVMGFISYLDEVTPMATGLTAFNALPNTHPRVLIHSTNRGHTNPSYYYQGRYDFIHRYFPSSVNTTPFPWSNNLGYHIDAGDSNTVVINTPYPIAGTIEWDTIANPNYEVEWSLVEGPDALTISNPNSYNTTLTFDSAGTYLIQFKGWDNDLLNSDQQFTYLVDYVTIEVEDIFSLPVELIDFKSQLSNDNDEVLLSWHTGSELNNKGFEVQRAENGTQNFIRIGWVEGADNNLGAHYSFTDKNISEGKEYYYRLQQYNHDSSFTYSPIVVESIPFKEISIDIFPSVVNEELSISINGMENQMTEIKIISAIGQVLLTENFNLQNEHLSTFNLSHLPRGLYFLHFSNLKGKEEIISFIKM